MGYMSGAYAVYMERIGSAWVVHRGCIGGA